MLERIIDIAADELEIDPVEIRRRNFIPPERFPLTTVTGANYDVGEYAKALDEALPHRRVRRAARRAGGARARGRHRAARHRRLAPTWRSPRAACSRSSARSRSTTTAPSPRPSARRRTAGPRDRVLDDRARAARRPDGAGDARAVRHRAVPRGHGHDGLALAADRRQRALQGERGGAGEGEAARRAPARGERRRHRVRRRPGSASPACRRRAMGWAELAAGREGRRPAARRGWNPRSRPRSTSTRARRRTRSARTSRSSRSTSRPAQSSACATSRSTTAGASSTRCSSRASSTAASRRASRRRCSKAVVYDDDGNPLTANLIDYAMPSAAELPELRGVEHGDAHAAEPARREGHRRVGHDRLDARGAERGRRRAVAPRHPPRRHAADSGTDLEGGRGRTRLTMRRITAPHDDPSVG